VHVRMKSQTFISERWEGDGLLEINVAQGKMLFEKWVRHALLYLRSLTKGTPLAA
jgi:hypothetical protein